MAQKIIYKKRFLNKLEKALLYLEEEWGERAASNFIDRLVEKISLIKKQPGIGAITIYSNTRSMLITKYNKIYYRLSDNTIEVINMINTKQKPEKNPFTKKGVD